MKRIVFGSMILLGLLVSFPSAAACQTIKFLNGDRFCFDIEKKSSTLFETKVSQKSVTSPGLFCNLLLPNNTTVYLPGCEGSFNYSGNGTHIVLKAETQNYTANIVTNYYFSHGSFEPDTSGGGNNPIVVPEVNQLVFYNISPLLPKKNERISLGLKVINSGGIVNPSFTQKVSFSVEEFRDGTRKSAYSSDYELSRTSYVFSAVDQGQVYFNQLIKFKTSEKFRLVASIENRPYYQTFKVGENTSVILDDNTVAFSAISSTSPRVDDWVNLSLEIRRNGAINTSFTQKVLFSLEEYRDGAWRSAYSSDYDLSRTSYTFTTADAGKVSFNKFLRFAKSGSFRLVVQLEGKNYYQSFNPRASSSPSNYELKIYDLSSSSPQVNEWVAIQLRAYKNGSWDRYFTQKVNFSLEEYRNGSWKSAYSSDYDLSRTSYTFSSSDEGEWSSNNFLRFYTQGTFRLLIVSPNSTTTQEFSVRKASGGSNYYQVRNLDIMALSPSTPKLWEWIDVRIRATDTRGDLVRDYDGKLYFEIEKRVGGSWKLASSQDYDLSYQSFRFYASDRGEKRFNDVLRFSKSGEYRIRVYDENDRSLGGVRNLTIDTDSYGSTSNTYYGSFTDREYKKMKAIYQLWPQVMVLLKKDYPRLRNNSVRELMSDTFYQNMRDAIYSDRGSFRDFSDFYQAFMEWFSYTSRAR